MTHTENDTPTTGEQTRLLMTDEDLSKGSGFLHQQTTTGIYERSDTSAPWSQADMCWLGSSGFRGSHKGPRHGVQGPKRGKIFNASHFLLRLL